MDCVVRSHYYTGIGRTAVGIIEDIYNRYSPSKAHIDANCGKCIYNMLTEVGAWYFAKKADKEAAAKIVRKVRKTAKAN